MALFDDAGLNIPCPDCGHETTKTIRWIKTNDTLTCKGCKQAITLDKQDLLKELKSADKSIADFQKSLGKFGKL